MTIPGGSGGTGKPSAKNTLSDCISAVAAALADEALGGGVRHDLVGRHGATADDLHEMQRVIEGGGGNEVDGVAGVHRRLSVTEELLEERGPLLDALRLQARDDAGPEARGVPQQLGYAA